LGRHEEDPLSQGLERGGLQLGRQTQPLEPVHEVVGEQEEMEVGLGREEVPSGNAAQGIVALILPLYSVRTRGE